MPLRARLYWHSKRQIADRLPRLNFPHSLVWLQLLGPAALEQVTRISYSGDKSGGFADADHNLRGLFDWNAASIEAVLRDHARILVIGAGAGRELIALARMGHEVVGIEPSASLVEAGTEHMAAAGVKAMLLLSAPSQIPGGLGVFDVVMFGRGVYHHIPRRKRRIAFLERCARNLKPGGTLMIGDTLIRSAENYRSSIFRGIARDEIGDSLGHGFFHYFTPEELAAEVEAAGYDPVHFQLSSLSPTTGDNTLKQIVARAKV